MSATWYYADEQGNVGPLMLEDLKATLATMPNPEDVLVWSEGFSKWTRAGDLPDLALEKIPRAKDLNGIAGWLILPALGTIGSPLLVAYSFLQMLPALSRLDSLPRPFAAVAVFEAVMSCALFLGWIVAIVQLFRHKRSYPKLFVALLAATFLITFIDLVATGALGIAFEADDAKNLMRPFLALVIWGPYMFSSKRVHATFVK